MVGEGHWRPAALFLGTAEGGHTDQKTGVHTARMKENAWIQGAN